MARRVWSACYKDRMAEADWSIIRYAMCWEDADVLLAALDVRPGDRCASVCSAGDNTLALLTRGPASVVAFDLSPAQLACLGLRVAAYAELDHGGLLELLGVRRSQRRAGLYAACRGAMGEEDRLFWDKRLQLVAAGIATAGKFEGYFRLFRRFVLPLVHGRRTRDELLRPKTESERVAFYKDRWDTRRWRLLFRLYFGRRAMGRLGRDPSFFEHVERREDVAGGIAARAEHALTRLDPSANPYLRAILTGVPGEDALPLAWRPEHFEAIRANLGRLTIRRASVADVADSGERFDRWNLSDVFEYMPPAEYARQLAAVVDATRPGGRLAYWNMAADRTRPESLADRLVQLHDTAADLHARDRAFFYKRLVVEEAT